ncbi:olfactory receptor family 14 subfamily A member 258 [Mus musculus]|uniref:Olfactory receptor n=1 Tax=Mus musculus TaxID=10090 RepID=Q7TS03_MOUSE|nr:olfactory receptor family 14 subfamily A member 258 [Mus musculus]AAP70846.1 olfactory receptor Olfr304 [Mus musculus]|eukprot:NP_001011828.1 olfactory receptor 304 [Mus musculus]
MPNDTRVTGFILMGFSAAPELQTVCGLFFLVMYLAVIMSNLLIITVITLDLKLQTPMYFFLKNLSLLDVFLVSIPIPKFIINNLTHNNYISILGCAFQILLMTSFSAGEIFVLTAMSYDRYVAICSPLCYEAIMSSGNCVLMVGVSWATGILFGALYTAGTFSMPFCGSMVIPQFFCDVPSLLRISCSGSLMIIYISLGIGMCLCMSCFYCVMISYFYIISTVLKIPTTRGQSKAFATCIPHLTVFSVFIATACFVYLKPPSDIPSITDRLFSVLYTVLPPALNPVIYSLRNSDVKCSLRRLQQNLCPRDSYYLTVQRFCQCYSASQVTSKCF